MPRKKVSTTLYIDPDQYAALKALAKRTRVPVAVYMREAVDHVLDRYATSEDTEPAPEPDAPPENPSGGALP